MASRTTSARSPFRTGRRGLTYVLVLGATLIVATMSVGGVLAVRSQLRITDSYLRSASARQYALAAVEIGLQEIAANTNWRTLHKNDSQGQWFSNRTIGSGTYSLTVVNPNGALDHSPSDPVVFTATGQTANGLEKQMVQVTVVPQTVPYTCLNAAMTADNGITLWFGSFTAFNQTLATNGNMSAFWSSVYANVQTVGTASGSTYLDSAPVTGVTARTMPDTTVFDYYKTNGTAIDINSLPTSNGTRTLNRDVLSPAINPYGTGATNSNGIYVIDCGGQTIAIGSCRIVGTLVLLNVGSGSQTQGQVTWSAVNSNYPCLLVQGDFSFQTDGTSLQESSGSHKYNPSGATPPATATPYPWGSANYNNSSTDSFPNVISGLCYVSGDVGLSNSPNLGMLISGGTITCTGSLTLTYNSVYLSNPPPGFYTLPMVISPGSWKQYVN